MKRKIFITRRLPLYIGTKCNIKCKFCYYYSETDDDNYSYDNIIAELERYKEEGIDSIDITGGEPTIHKDIIKIVKKASDMGFKEITMITNGIAVKTESFLDKLIEAGVNTWVLSIHGHNAEIHDGLTGRKGTFNDMLKTIDNFNKRNLTYSVNFVVNRQNFGYLREFAKFVNQTCIKTAVTFLVMNPMGDGKINFDSFSVKYSELGSLLYSAIEELKRKGNKVTWKFMPLCASKENIDITDSILTFFFTPYDWNYSIQYKLKYGDFDHFFALIKNFSRFSLIQLAKIPLVVLKHMALLNANFGYMFKKLDSCKQCMYFYVCDGISKNYIQLFGQEEFRPIEGRQFINPMELTNQQLKLSFFGIAQNFIFFAYSKIAYLLISIFRRKLIKKRYALYQASLGLSE
ncbi:MAG: radical SAM protein [Brevinematales bacterium]|jgi:MoaA/NifB/PqqE/SkfB family radical SAM enzyme